MDSCLIFCSEKLVDSEKGANLLIEHYESRPTDFPLAIEIARTKYDAMFPYLLGILASEDQIDELDEWIYEGKINIPSREVCMGAPRLYEFKNYADKIARWELADGKAREIKGK